jgi:drug/metabolite transporter (DMT)-like permease
MPRLPAAQIGVLLMLLGMALFSLNDALGKWLVASHSVGQVLLIRSLAALVVLAPFLWSFGSRGSCGSNGRVSRRSASPSPRPRCSASTSPSATCRSPT